MAFLKLFCISEHRIFASMLPGANHFNFEKLSENDIIKSLTIPILLAISLAFFVPDISPLVSAIFAIFSNLFL